MSVPKGFRDIEPQVARVRYAVIDALRRTYELYGFEPLDTPAIEYWETLAGKYGEEAETKLIWRFADPLSGREYALRYDLTVPLARYVASRPDLPLPFKRYQIGVVWRHEEPQRMRYREFLQADADIVGSPYVEADAEVLNVTLRGLTNAGLNDAYARVNHRVLVSCVFKNFLLLEEDKRILRVVDKLDKIGLEGVRKELLGLGVSEGTVNRLMEVISVRGGWDEVKGTIASMTGGGCEKVVEELSALFSLLEPGNSSRTYFDMSLVRGLDYYTGPIFEFGVLEAQAPSVGGGGRYDGLIGLFSRRGSIPATGASIGVDRVVDILLERGKGKARRGTKVLVVHLSPELFQKAWDVAALLRDRGIAVEVDLMRRSEAKQRKRAASSGASHILFVGEKEVRSGVYTLYDTKTGERVEVKLDEVASLLSKRDPFEESF